MKPRANNLAVVAICILMIASCGQKQTKKLAGSMSPADWPEGEIEKYLYIDPAAPRNVGSEGSTGIITGTSSAFAIRAGFEALKQGGTAADAVVATSLAQITHDIGAAISFTGFYNMVYYDAGTGEVHSLNATYNTVQGEDDPGSIPTVGISVSEGEFPMPEPSGRNVLVPGFMAGIQATHDRFGKLPFESLFAPSIWLAENGFPLAEPKVNMIAQQNKMITRLPEGKALFTKTDGSSYTEGDIFKQPALAETLSKVAEQGVTYMYTGDWAHKFVEAVQREGGKMTLQDLADYKVIWSEPIRSAYKGYEIAGPGLPAYGGAIIAEAMNLVEAAGLEEPVWESPETFFWLSQITRMYMLTTGLGSEQFDKMVQGRDLSMASRASQESADWIWEQMKAGKFPFTKAPAPKDINHSAGVVAVDQWGNMAAVLHTINTLHWGSTGIFVDGISTNDSAWVNLPQIIAVGPGNRIPDPTNPLIVLKDGKPFLGSSSIGMGLHMRTTQCLINVLDHSMTPKQAIDAPAFMTSDFDPAAGPHPPRLVVEGQFDSAFLDKVRALGQGVKVVPVSQRPLFQGYWIGVTIDPETGIMRTGAPVVTIAEPLPTSLAY